MCSSLFSTIVGTITGGIIGIVAAYCSSIWSRHTAFKAIRITEFNKAAVIFRSAFVDTKYRLRQNAEDGEELIHKIFTQEVLIAQEKAKILFEPFFDKFNLDGFNNTWERYTKSSYDYRESNILPLVNKTSILS